MKQVLLFLLCAASQWVVEQTSANKTTAQKSRLLYSIGYFHNGTMFVPFDSVYNYYTGTTGYNGVLDVCYSDSNLYERYLTSTSAYRHNFKYANAISSGATATLNSRTQINWDTVALVYKNALKHTYLWDINYNVTVFEQQTWNAGTSMWVNSDQVSYGYDMNNNLIAYLYKGWDVGTSSWKNGQRHIYTYTGTKKLSTILKTQWNSSSSIWEDYSKTICTYDGSDNKTIELVQSWNGTGWENLSQTVYTYDVNNRVATETREIWNIGSNSWNGSQRFSYTYTTSGKQATVTGENWDAGTFAWLKDFKQENNYNTFDQIKDFIVYRWDNTSSSFVINSASRKSIYVYELYNTSTAVESAKKHLDADIKLYPCPASSVVSIGITTNEKSSMEMMIYDMAGRIMAKRSIEPTVSFQVTIPVDYFPNGEYSLVLKAGCKVTARQFSVQH